MKALIITACVAAGLLTVSSGQAEEARDASLYIGVKSCKMCHKSEKKGNQFGKWEDSSHSKAYTVLAGEAAKATAAKLKIDNPQKSGKCLQCHSSAYNFTETKQTDKMPVEDGVSCESCHGPGKNYKSMSVMKDHDKCIKNGLIYPATKSCKRCHNEKSPTWNPEKYTTKDGKKVGFDAEQAYKKIEHPNPNAKK